MEGNMVATAQPSGRPTSQFAFVPAVHGREVPSFQSEPRRSEKFFSDSAELGPLAAVATTASFEAGTQILIEGDPAAHLFHIDRGVVKAYRMLSDGRCQITGFLFAGDFLGLAPAEVYISGAVAVG